MPDAKLLDLHPCDGCNWYEVLRLKPVRGSAHGAGWPKPDANLLDLHPALSGLAGSESLKFGWGGLAHD